MVFGLFEKKGGRKILIVDDDPAILRMLKAILSGIEAELLFATDGQQAIDMAVKETPNLIILDIMMSEVSGWDALKTLRQFDKTRKTPVLILTAKDMLGDAEKSFTLGANAFLQKPFTAERLKAKVRKLLG